MKIAITLASFAALTLAAPAAPYLLYTGSDYAYSFPSINNTATEQNLYLVTDLADTSTFAILEINKLTGTYTILARPSATPTTEEANNNFFGSVPATGNRPGGTAILAFGDDTVGGSGTTFVSHAYGTGPLTTGNFTLVPARNRPLTVTERMNGAATDTVTFPTSAAIGTGGTDFARSVDGTLFSYQIASNGTLPQATAPGNFGIGLSAYFTSLANIGGALQVGRNNVYAVQPVTITTTEEDAFVTFLTNLATDLGATAATPAAVVAGSISASGTGLTVNTGPNTYSGSTTIGSGTLSASGSGTTTVTGTTTSSGTSTVQQSGGVLTVNGGTLDVGTGTTFEGTVSASGTTTAAGL